MPSDLQVTNIKANDGTAGLVIADSTGQVTGTLGSATVFPAGHLLQVVGNTIDSTVVLGTSYTSVISKEITGVLSSSRILVIVCGGGAGYNSSTIECSYKIVRGTSESDPTVKEYDIYSAIEGDSHWRPCPVSLQGLDESPSTGNITYTVWGKKNGGYWNSIEPNMTIFEISG